MLISIKIISTNYERKESHIIKKTVQTVRANNSININKADNLTSNHLTQKEHDIYILDTSLSDTD